MEDQRLEGFGHQVKGAVKQSIGKAIGDAKLAADGAAERTIGDQQVAAGLNGGDQIFGIDTGRVMGIVNQFKGALMQGVGSLVGNPKLQADGIAQQRAGKAQNVVGGDRDEERQASDRREATLDTGDKDGPPQAETYIEPRP